MPIKRIHNILDFFLITRLLALNIAPFRRVYKAPDRRVGEKDGGGARSRIAGIFIKKEYLKN
jgi:hypothetical protein